METKNTTKDIGQTIASWVVEEVEKHEKTRGWYVVALAVIFLFLMYAFFTANILFAFIVIISGMIIILNDGRQPDLVDVALTNEGVIVGRKFFEYEEFEDFSIVYKPKYDIKNLYFEFKNKFRPRLSLPLKDINPLTIRENLLQFLPEDIDRNDQPASEGLAKLFKL